MRMIPYIRIFSSLFLGLASISAYAQCDDEDFLDDCAGQLGDYRFVKSYNSDFSNNNKDENIIEFSYVFSKGTNYVITICGQSQSGDQMIVDLYDRNRKKITSSYNRKTKKHYSKIGYTCSATGVYYLKTKSTGQKGGCGVCIIGIKK